MIDVDNFKTINDICGHDAGDLVLRDLAKVLQFHVRGEDVVCRFGGEEFCVVMPGADREAARQRAEMIRASVMVMPLAGSKIGPVTVSVGVAATGKGLTGSAQLLKAADEALYEAKQNGRNRVAVSSRGVANELPPPPELRPPDTANTRFA
jgi:diguanylate cyclase (GGDEF)-like protein